MSTVIFSFAVLFALISTSDGVPVPPPSSVHPITEEKAFEGESSVSARTQEVLDNLSPRERAAVRAIVVQYYKGRTTQQLMAAMRAAAPTLHHYVALANNKIHDHNGQALHEMSGEFSRLVAQSSPVVRTASTQLAEQLTHALIDIDGFIQKEVAHKAMQIANNIPYEEETNMRRAITTRLDFNKATTFIEQLRQTAPALTNQLDTLANDVQRKFNDYVTAAKQQTKQYIDRSPRNCPQTYNKIAKLLESQLGPFGIAPGMEVQERNVVSMQLLGSLNDMQWQEVNSMQRMTGRMSPAQMDNAVSQQAPTVEEAIHKANTRMFQILKRRLDNIHEYVKQELAKPDSDSQSCGFEVERMFGTLLDNIANEAQSFLTDESHQIIVSAFGKLKAEDLTKVRHQFTTAAGYLKSSDIADELQKQAPTMRKHYDNIMTITRTTIGEKEAEIKQIVDKAVADQEHLPNGHPYEAKMVLTEMSQKFFKSDTELVSFIGDLLPQLALRMLAEQPYTEREQMKETIYRWLTNDYDKILDSIRQQAPSLYVVLGPFRDLVEQKRRMLRADAARVFQETASESLRKFLYYVTGEKSILEVFGIKFSVRESLKALPVEAQRQMSELVRGLSAEQKRIFALMPN